MFTFRNFQCEFNTCIDMFGNHQVYVYTDEGILLYQLTQELSVRIPDGMVAFKEASFVFPFLAQMQTEGLLTGGLERRTLNGNKYLLGKIVDAETRQKRAAVSGR